MQGVFIITCNKQIDHISHNYRSNIIGGSSNHNKTYRYDELINALIKAEKIKRMNPTFDVLCSIDRSAMIDPDVKRSFKKVYDRLVLTDETEKGRSKLNKIVQKYQNPVIKHATINQIDTKVVDDIDDAEFYNDYEYSLVKQKVGPDLSKHFMFKEHELTIDLRGGFNPRRNKIKFKKKSNPKFTSACELYQLYPDHCEHIKTDHMEYLHLDRRHRYIPPKLSPMFENIECYNYLEPIKLLSQYHSPDSYYKNILELYSDDLKKLGNTSMSLHTTDRIDPIDRDLIALEYIKCRPSVSIITLWMPALPALDKFLAFLNQEGEIVYMKTISFSKRGLKNLMMQFYDEFGYGTAYDFIDKKLSYIDTQETNNAVCFIMFDNVKQHKISGQGAKFKTILRNKLMEIGNIDKNKYRGNDLIHINDYFYQTYEYCQLILNNNSLQLMEIQDCNAYEYNDWILGHLKFQTLRHVMYSNMSLLEMDRLIMVGGIVFYANSIRSFNDIDAVVIDIEPNISDEFTKTIERLFSIKSSKLFFLDAAMKGSSYWRDSWTKKDQPILDFLGIESDHELVLNPRYHMYYQGVKMVNFEFEMIRKLIRNRTEDHIDFVMISSLNPQLIDDYLTVDTKKGVVQFIPTKRYSDIMSKPDTRFLESRYKILKRRYSSEQIKIASKTPQYKLFFEPI
jgi:hypothetical protein